MLLLEIKFKFILLLIFIINWYILFYIILNWTNIDNYLEYIVKFISIIILSIFILFSSFCFI